MVGGTECERTKPHDRSGCKDDICPTRFLHSARASPARTNVIHTYHELLPQLRYETAQKLDSRW